MNCLNTDAELHKEKRILKITDFKQYNFPNGNTAIVVLIHYNGSSLLVGKSMHISINPYNLFVLVQLGVYRFTKVDELFKAGIQFNLGRNIIYLSKQVCKMVCCYFYLRALLTYFFGSHIFFIQMVRFLSLI
jgi:hypothetical protein